MNRSFKTGRLGATYCWRIGSQPHLRCLQKRHYADRLTIDDLTQSRLEAAYKATGNVDLPRENPWRSDYPEDLNQIGYESHCNDRVYMAKNKLRQSQQEYDQKRLERRLETQKRFQKHFKTVSGPASTEVRNLSIMQDPSEHQQRQEDIIEMNRRLWQSRPQVKREINLSGITYRPDYQKHMPVNAPQKRDLMQYREMSQGDKEAEAETSSWVRRQMGQGNAETKAEAEESVFQRRVKKLMEKADWRKKRPMGRAEKESKTEANDNWWTKRQLEAEAEENSRMGVQAQDSPLQRRLMKLMEDQRDQDAEEDRRVKSPKAEAEEEDWRVKSPKAAAEEEDWRVRGRKPEAEEEDWRVKRRRGEAEEEDWRMKVPKAEDWRVRGRRPEAEEEDWRIRSQRPEAEEEDWRMKIPKAEEDWRVRGRRPEAEEEDWRVQRPRAEAEEEDWRLKGWGKDLPVRSQSSSPGFQQRLMELMEAEKKPEAEEEDWRTQSPKAEAEGSPRSEAETQEDAEDKAWKARHLSRVYDPNRTPKQKKDEQDIESQYWHSWQTCPSAQDAETIVQLKAHPRRRKVTFHAPPYTRHGQRRSYHKTALNPQPMEVESEPLGNAPLMPRPLRASPKEKKSKPKQKRERKSVEPPRFKMTIRSRPLVARRPTLTPSYLRRLDLLSEVAGPSFQMANLHKTPLKCSYAG